MNAMAFTLDNFVQAQLLDISFAQLQNLAQDFIGVLTQ